MCQICRGICWCNRKIFWTSATNVTTIRLFFVFEQKKLFKIEEESYSHILYTKSVSNLSGHPGVQSEKNLDFYNRCYQTMTFLSSLRGQKQLFKIEEKSWSHMVDTKCESNVPGHLLVQSENFFDFCKKCYNKQNSLNTAQTRKKTTKIKNKN